MAIDPKAKEATPSDKEWISRALGVMPDPAIAPRPAAQAYPPSAAGRAANDDRQSIGDLLRSLQLRPTHKSYLVASFFATAWIVGGLALGIVYLPELATTLVLTPAAVPVLLGLGALLVLPVSFFFMLAHMTWRAKELRLVTESMASLALRLAEPQSAAQETIAQVSETMHREIAVMNDSVEHTLARAAELETRVNGQAAALERANREADAQSRTMTQRLAEQHVQLGAQAEEVRNAVAAGRDYSEQAVELMRSYLDGIDARINAKADELAASIERGLHRFQQAVESRSRAVDESLGARAEDMIKTVHESGKDLAATLDRRVKDASVIIDARTAALTETIGAKIEELDKTLEHRVVAVTQNLEARIARFEDVAAGRAQEVASQIEMQTQSAAEALDRHVAQVAQSIKHNAVEAAGLVETRSKAAADILAGRMQQIAQAIETRTADARQALGKLAEDSESRIVSASSNASASLKGDAHSIETKLTALSANISAALSQNAQQVERTLLGASADAAHNFVGQAEHINSAMREHTAAMTKLLDEKSGGLLVAVAKRSKEFAAEVVRATDQAVKSLEAQGQTFTKAVSENGARIAADIGAAGKATTEAVGQSLKLVEESTKAAFERSKQATGASLSEMREVHGLLRTDGIAIFERLREANVLLREALSGAHDSIGTLEKKLGKRLGDLLSTMKEVNSLSGTVTGELTGHMGSFQESALKVLEDLSQLAAQFESHGHSLVQTVDLIDNINQRTVDTVNDRGAVLDSLITTLDTRAADFENRLLRFSTLLEESLDTATARTRDIGLLIAEASSQGVRAITEQYDIVRSTVDQENHRTADMLRNLYQSTVGEAQTSLQQSAERFTELLQGIKRMASDMQRELEVTREELRRGVLDIPRETADSMTQMRQVIIDQVEALAELHRIVAKHGRAGSGGPDSRRPLSEDMTASAASGGRAERIRREPPPPALPPPAAPRGNAAPGARGSWLTDLLHRASRDDEPQRYAIDSLDALSGDIARLIDHNAAADLWDRYNRGERNVFTRKLYTAQGQKVFDEVRGRYRSDRDFKQTVDRYLSEFERLLEDVSRDDHGQTMLRTYLNSETGKVYTMLAHAAGRFD